MPDSLAEAAQTQPAGPRHETSASAEAPYPRRKYIAPAVQVYRLADVTQGNIGRPFDGMNGARGGPSS
jgi:hypothetical protein